jgi:hypothetical protein
MFGGVKNIWALKTAVLVGPCRHFHPSQTFFKWSGAAKVHVGFLFG